MVTQLSPRSKLPFDPAEPPLARGAARSHTVRYALAIWAMIAITLIWGISPVAIKVVVDHTDPISLSFYRSIIAALTLTAAVVLSRRRPALNWATALMGFFGAALFQVLYNAGIAHGTASAAALLEDGMEPVFVALLVSTIPTFKERLGGRKLVGLLASLLGLGAIVVYSHAAGQAPFVGASLLGGGLLLVSALCYATYEVIGQKACAADSALPVAAGVMVFSTLFLLPFASWHAVHSAVPSLSWGDITVILYLGIGCSAVVAVLQGFAFAHLKAHEVSIFSNAITPIGVITGVIILHDPLKPAHLLGIILIITGIFVTTKPEPEQEQPDTNDPYLMWKTRRAAEADRIRWERQGLLSGFPR